MSLVPNPTAFFFFFFQSGYRGGREDAVAEPLASRMQAHHLATGAGAGKSCL